MNSPKHKNYDVMIIGGGPAGLSAATTLKKSGIERVVVLDREPEAGGIPRHCGHPPFGIKEYRRVMKGSAYAGRLVQTAREVGVEIALKTTVIGLHPEGLLSIVSPEGSMELKAKRVLIATGARETPRSARLVSGDRPLGICNTGALQSMVYLKNIVPFQRPLVVGTEIVSFSALFTCRKAGIKPVAILEEKNKPTVAWPIYYVARVLGVPLHMNTRIENILGTDRVTGVQIADRNGNKKEINCDGVLFTGRFTPESSLARMSHLEIDKETGCLLVDQYGRCSDPAYYAAGNILYQPVEVAGKCWNKGRMTAGWITEDLVGKQS